MKHNVWQSVVGVIGLMAAAASVDASGNSSRVVEPGQRFFGKSYNELVNEWTNWLVVEPLGLSFAVVAGLVAALLGLPAAADTPGCKPPTGWLTVSSPAVAMGDPVTVSWGTTLPKGGCGYAVKVHGPGLSSSYRSGSETFIPSSGDYTKDYGRYSLSIKGIPGNGFPLFSTGANVRIDIPQPDNYGRRTINITRDYQTPEFVRAILVPNANVNLADDVNLNLTYWSGLDIERGVHITGGRSSTKPGPRLFTTAIRTAGPEYLFRIGTYLDADRVRISGVRIDGGDMGIAGNGITQDNDPVTPVGILVNSSRNVKIANSEIYGWSGIAIKVKDERDRSDASNWAGVWIHDNYIHHNQRYRHEGYGVQAHDGAHVLIERNVFDYNRHSLEASGAPGTGYRAYNNLVGPNGGVNSLVTNTHALDVHGTLDCDGYDAYCGPAGEYFDYRHNALWYTAGDVLKVRGEPSIGGHVIANVFVKDQWFGAITQTEGTNLWDWDPAPHYSVSNQYNASATLSSTVCDFDGDGRADDFVATGTNWWYKSAATGQYFYLATSLNKTGTDIAPRDVNGDGRCDVTDSSGVYVNRSIPGGGATARLTAAAKRGDIIATKPYTGPNTPGSVRMWQVSPDLTGISSDKTVDWRIRLDGGPEPLENGMLLAAGDFNADGAPDLLWRSENSNQVAVTLLDDNGDVLSPAESHLRSISTASQLRGTIECCHLEDERRLVRRPVGRARARHRLERTRGADASPPPHVTELRASASR